MKKAYLWISGIVTIIALIICFENIMVKYSVLILFTYVHSLFLALLIMFSLGVVAGMFLALTQLGKKRKGMGDDYEL